jgi:hypothetical protein
LFIFKVVEVEAVAVAAQLVEECLCPDQAVLDLVALRPQCPLVRAAPPRPCLVVLAPAPLRLAAPLPDLVFLLHQSVLFSVASQHLFKSVGLIF